MKYLLISEDGEMTQVDEPSGEDLLEARGGILEVVRLEDMKYYDVGVWVDLTKRGEK